MLRKAIILRLLPCRTQTASCFPAGCGCPPGWELGLRGLAPGEPQYRPADLVDFLLHRSFRNFQQASRPRRCSLTAQLTLFSGCHGHNLAALPGTQLHSQGGTVLGSRT